MGQGQSAVNFEEQLANDTKMQCVELPAEKANESVIRRNKGNKDGLATVPFPNENNGGYKTLWEAFQRPVGKYPQNNFIGTRHYDYDDKNKESRGAYIYDTYEQADQLARHIGSALVALGIQENQTIGIFSNNRAEWLLTALGAYSQSMTVVSLYATLGAEAVEYIVNHAETPIVFVSKENMKQFLAVLPKIKGCVKFVVQYDYIEKYGNKSESVEESARKTAAENGMELYGFTELLKLGKEKENFPNPCKPETNAFIMYTSGTTGNPKGVLIKHSAITAAVTAGPAILPDLGQTDVYLSYLPLAHIFETAVHFICIMVGATICYFQGNIKKISDDLNAVKPTIFAGVPRIYQRFYQKIMEGVTQKNCFVKWFFQRAYAFQCQQVRLGRPLDKSYDQKIFVKLRDMLGLSRCKIMISGGAPCPPYILEFLKVLMGRLDAVVQGYGMTETSAANLITLKEDPNIGHCGPPVPACEVKLVDVPDMNYLSTDKPCPRGEIHIRGPLVFSGYYKDPENTASTLIDGWVATGDIGRFNANGTTSIIDRKKNMFKLSQGEYIAAEKVEAEYAQCPLIGQFFVYGNSFHSTLLAVVVPAAEPMYQKFVENGWWPSKPEETQIASDKFIEDFNTVCQQHSQEIKQMIVDGMKQYEKPLKGFERVADILIESRIDKLLQGFSEQNGCLTPTFKLRRNNLLARYIKEFKEMYTKLGEAPNPSDKWPGEQ